MTDVTVPAPQQQGTYFPDMVILYGVKLNTNTSYGAFDAGDNGKSVLRMQLFHSNKEESEGNYSIVLGYGYAFEGNCYRMDANRFFIVKDTKAEAAVGCGFDLAGSSGSTTSKFSMWRIRSSEKLLEIGVNAGDFKSLVLDGNVPGKRSPASYAITASLAHRDGRFSRE
ncbi:hypothetical protein [Paracoccus aestuariivivens]|uniref:Uncharacterized protein n=1 Tax=Paracoccus aestuariivivens TaxID=1820333 RepID=A0A6L6JAA9_9RHOB|nr:hypothetical protein [Paracoccus aestuariivivens]MTH78105.1 hypothetical protein [Paracoccus aestuariivivens]